jgi:hypothetical protein
MLAAALAAATAARANAATTISPATTQNLADYEVSQSPPGYPYTRCRPPSRLPRSRR